MSTRVLFVDDDPHALAGFQRALKGRFDVEVASSGQQGLQTIATRPPFAVVVADMRMPGLNGVQFLHRVRELSPNSVRMILTGNADLQGAIDAVNDGSIFRFLCKPCATPELAAALAEGWAEYEVARAERDLLEQTVRGSVKVLTEVLAIVNPLAFGRAVRMADIVGQLAAKARWPDAWRFEVAALLSQLGCVSLTNQQLDAVNAGTPLASSESQRASAHHLVARDLVAQIPRLQDVAQMIGRQRESHGTPHGDAASHPTRDAITAGARMLRLAHDLDVSLAAGIDYDEAIARLHHADHQYDPALLCHLHELVPPKGAGGELLEVAVDALEMGMVMQEDLRTANGLLLVPRGQTITDSIQQRLRNFSRVRAISGAIRVQRPAQSTMPA